MDMRKDTASAGAFRARSGRTVRVEGNGTVVFDHANGYLSPESAMDAEEFFQAKRDEELGRWRWPENPDFVVKHDPLGVRIAHVLHEPSFAARVVHPDEEVVGLSSARDKEFMGAARAYFEAHPERKPWEEAAEDEIWALTFDTAPKESVWVWNGREWVIAGDFHIPLAPGFRITAGRRIWPEEAA